LLTGLGAASTLGLAGCTGGGLGGGGNQSSNYPSEDLSIIVPYATGGGFDAYARLSTSFWEEHLPSNPTVNVENVVGGGGVTGTTQLYNAEPNGYTIGIWDTFQAVTQQIGREVGFDIREMSYIGALTQSPNCLISMNSAGINSWEDIARNPGKFNWATQGVGAISHIGPIMLGELTNTWSTDDINFVHFGGTGEALAGLERGEAQIFMAGPATSGLKVIESINAEMTILFSEPVDQESIYSGVPRQYASELGVENMGQFADLTVFRRFFTGPPGVPEQVLEVQREAFSAMVNDEELLSTAQENGRPIVNPGSAEQVSDAISDAFSTFNSDPFQSIIRQVFQS
jgi:tripartite-type tricarboxylate transporter receptor subunit TctC